MSTDLASVRLVRPGWQTLVVDLGRPRSRSLGLPVGGAADRSSLALGNALVGNPADAPALEINLAGPTLVADAPLPAVVFGTAFDLYADGLSLRVGNTFTLPAGVKLHIAGASAGARCYLCVVGGWHVPTILGSASSLEALPAGTELGFYSKYIPSRALSPDLTGGEPQDLLHVVPGRQTHWFERDALTSTTFTVSADANRMGLRLLGPALSPPAVEMVSEPMCPGTIQVTRDGQCIILGIDGQTLGGYPKIAHVIRGDLDKLAQLAPGKTVRFRWVSLAEANARWERRQAWLRGWLTRLRVTANGP